MDASDEQAPEQIAIARLLNPDVAIEGRLDRIEGRLDKIDDRLHGVETGMARLEGKVDIIAAKLPSWWHFPAAISGLIAVCGGLFGLLRAFHLLSN